MKRTTLLRVVLALALIGGVLIAKAGPATASFHLVAIGEVYAGGPDKVQFIELTMYSGFQTQVGGQSVEVFDPSGAKVGTFTFAGSVSNGQQYATILVATAEAEAHFGLTADLRMTHAPIQAAGGKVCFTGAPDCVSWGSYSGGATGAGTPFAGAIPADQSLQRKTDKGSNPNQVDSADDTDNSANDMKTGAPTPKNNAGQTGGGSTSPSPSPSGSTSPSPSPSGSPSPGPAGPPSSTISFPTDKGSFGKARLEHFEGTAEADGGDLSVEIALRKTNKSGKCQWWDGSAFLGGPCATKVFVAAEGGEDWVYDFTGSFQLSNKKKAKTRFYHLYSRATCSNCTSQTETTFEPGRNANRFDVK